MSSINIELPSDLKAFVDAQATAAGYGDAGAYVENLLRALWKERSRDELEAKLIAASESGPAIEATPEFWAALRARVQRRAGNPST